MESATSDTVRIGGMDLRFLVDETQGSGGLVMFEMVVQPNARVPVPHYHREVDEIVYGLSGALTTTVNGEKREIERSRYRGGIGGGAGGGRVV
jgi:quercetin dioxygenase-like cupin family protein